MVNQSRQLTSTNNEFSGSTQNYRDWKISVTSQLSTISSAYKLQMAENPQLINFDSIRPRETLAPYLDFPRACSSGK